MRVKLICTEMLGRQIHQVMMVGEKNHLSVER